MIHAKATTLLILLSAMVFAGCEYLEADNVDLRVSRWEVNRDDNADGIPNPGESFDLVIYLENTGTADSGSLDTTLSSEDPYIHLNSDEGVSYHVVEAGSESGPSYGYSDSFSIDVAATAPDGYEAVLMLHIEDLDEHEWDLTITLVVQENAASVAVSRVEIASDDNGDGLPSPGERIGLSIWLANTGSNRVPGPETTLSSISSDVVVSDDHNEQEYPTLEPGEESAQLWGYTYLVDISPTVAAGSRIPLSLRISDELDTVWTATFDLRVMASQAQLQIVDYEITNSDGVANPGDSIYLILEVENIGTSRAEDVDGTMSCTDGGATVTDADADFGTLGPGETGLPWYSDRFQLSIDSERSVDTPILLTFSFTDQLDNTWQDTLELPLSDP